MFAKIVVDLATEDVDQLYTYKIPNDLIDCIYLGSRVFVEFGFQKVLGFVLEIVESTDFLGNLKEILEVVDFENGLNEEQIMIAKKLAIDLMTPLTNTLNIMYPSFMKSKIKKKLEIINYDKLDAEVALLFDNKKGIIIDNKILSKYSKIKKEIEKGNLEISTSIYTYGKRKLEKYYSLNKFPMLPSTEKRLAVIEYLKIAEEATLEEIREFTGANEYVVNKLLESGHLKYIEKLPRTEEFRRSISYEINKSFDFNLVKSKYQKVESKPYLFHTNDYEFRDDFLLDISRDTIKEGKQVLILAPTILEQTRLTKYFSNKIDARVRSFSSKLSNNEYYYNYNEILNDEVDLVIATRTGAFLPLSKIGLIIVVDSENKYYLNEQNPKFNTLEVAKIRSEFHNAKLVYQSSAPSIELYYQYYTNKYTLIRKLKEDLHDVDIVNMKEEYLNNLISSKLDYEIRSNLKNKKITVLILNSLAYNQTILCSECMKLITCPECKVGLSYHKIKNVYQCPSCNYSVARIVCSCGSSKVKHFGYGLELLKEVLVEDYNNPKIIQVDSENMLSDNDYNDFFLALEEKDVDIIIGTNQLSSFFHEDIKLVGYINIDSLLNKNDYRSSEETFSLISNLRVNKNAKVIIQGYNIDHYSVLDAVSGDYDKFFEKEQENRKTYNYPPFNEISRLLVIGEYKDIYYFSNYFKKVFSRMSTTNILGPVYISRLKGIQLIIKYDDFERLSKLIDEVKNKFKEKKLIVNFERYPLSFN